MRWLWRSLAAQFGSTGVVNARQPDDLKFFKNYFVTGDYVVAGVGLSGLGDSSGVATGNINVQGVPAGAEILAAQLYWQVVSAIGPLEGSVGATFKGHPLETPDNASTPGFDPEPYGKVMTFAGAAPCFNPGGGTGNPGNRHTFSYRLDVLRFFDIDTNEASPTFGRTIVNGLHEFQAPDSGPNGNQGPIALGASLFIVFRFPEGHPQANVLNSIVVYDDGLSLNNSQQLLVQPMRGHYKAAAVPNARISYIVGSGQADKGDAIVAPGGGYVVNPFVGANGPAWDTFTYPRPNTSDPAIVVAPTEVSTTITTDVQLPGGRDCITPAAIVFKTAVEDTDGDGLLDVWETATTGSPLSDPRGRQLPPLGSMGANKNRKDLYVEVGYMDALQPLSYGGVPAPAHSHRPTLEALKLMGKAFNDAPVPDALGNPNAGIAVHFDVGPGYFDSCSSASPDCANHYIIGQRVGDSTSNLVVRGGESVNEMATVTGCVLDATKPWICQYSDFPGTVGWKTGFRLIQDEALSISPTPPPPPATTPPTLPKEVEESCDQPGYTCVRRFDEVRRNMFHYSLFAHHLGYPQSFEPFLPNSTNVNPLFRKPVTNTGVGDFPGGGDVLVTLGAFLDNDNVTPTGTSYMQASTLMHELGHNLNLRHGGALNEPNCKPPYLSVMNYLYQLRGLLDDLGKPNLGFASPSLQTSYAWPTIDEDSLTDGSLGLLRYRLGWYTPLNGSYLDPALNPASPSPAEQALRIARAAKRHCNGNPIVPADNEPLMVRVDAFRADTSGNSDTQRNIDWDADGTIESGVRPPQDVNFSGSNAQFPPSDTLAPSDDWANLRLNQVGSRRSPAGYYLVYKQDGSIDFLLAGPLSINESGGDLGPGDLAAFSLSGPLGGFKDGFGGFKDGFGGFKDGFGGFKDGFGGFKDGLGDLGGFKDGLGGFKDTLGGFKDGFGSSGDRGLGDHGGGDLFHGQGEVNVKHATDLARTPPNEFNATQGANNYVTVTFKAPNLGGVQFYTVRRVAGSIPVIAKSSIVPGTITPGVNGVFSMTDLDSHRLKAGADYSYFATATYLVEADGGGTEPVESEISRVVTLNIHNDPPVINVSNIPISQSIATNSTTVALPFTVTDPESDNPIGNPLKDLSVTPVKVSSTNPALLAEISFDPVKGFGATRSVRVIHSGTQTGTVTVRLDVTDTQCSVIPFPPQPCTPGTTSSTTFTVTVNATVATFAPVSNIPPAAVAAGTPVVMRWGYMPQNAGNNAVPTATVVGPSPSGQVRTYSGTAFLYTNSTKTWRFTLPTGAAATPPLPAGTYQVVIGPSPSAPAGYRSSQAFSLVITP